MKHIVTSQKIPQIQNLYVDIWQILYGSLHISGKTLEHDPPTST